MKYLITAICFVFSTSSCNSNIKEPLTVQEKSGKLTFNKNFYWINASLNNFYALNFDSTDNVYCTLYSFGDKELESEKRYLVKSGNRRLYELFNLDNGKIEGKINLVNDSTVDLSFSKSKGSYVMAINENYQKLFNKVKSKFAFKCIKSDEVIYNEIVCYSTKSDLYLKDSRYEKKREKYNDQMYGEGEYYYLDYKGNKFYYNTEKENNFFYKIIIENNEIENCFLNIRVGDSKEIVIRKLKEISNVYRETKSGISLRICNSRHEGLFGYLTLEFPAKEGSADSKILKRIIYNPFFDGE